MPKNFTLVELMIVVAIIGILAAIAIPNFYRMQMMAKRAELGPNTEGLHAALVAYTTESGASTCLAGSWAPASTIGKNAQAWTTPSWACDVDYTPDGAVRGTYGFGMQPATFSLGVPTPYVSPTPGPECPANEHCAWGITDLDEDDYVALWRAHDTESGPSAGGQDWF